MSLEVDRVSKAASNALRSFKGGLTYQNVKYNRRSFIDIWQKELDDEFQKAEQSNYNFVITPPAGTLFFAFADTGFGEQMAHNIAIGVCEYWSKAIALGSPAHLDLVVSVSNDAMTHEIPLWHDILSIRRNTQESDSGYFTEIHKVIMQHVKAMLWTVTEMNLSDGSTSDFIENVF